MSTFGDHVSALAAARVLHLHMPGHRGGAAAPPELLDALGEKALALDVSEIGGLDYLHHPRTALAAQQREIADAVGAQASYLLVNGATVGNLAAILAVSGDGDCVAIQRSSHRSVYAGLIASGARPVYVSSRRDTRTGLDVGIDVAELERVLSSHTVAAVHITSPTYYGACADVEAVAALTCRYGTPLIVDEAHGSHFPFSDRLPSTALSAGADIVVHSPHKQLGALTQSAVLHVGGVAVDHSLRFWLQSLQTSSPSALLMLSLGSAYAYMQQHGAEMYSRAVELAEQLRAEFDGRRRAPLLPAAPGKWDPLKLVMDFSSVRVTGTRGYESLRRSGVIAELADDRYAVLTLGVRHRPEEVAALRHAFEVCQGLFDETASAYHAEVCPTGRLVFTPRQAVQAAQERVSLRVAEDRVSSEFIVPYPPGVPAVVPGEVILPETVRWLTAALKRGIRLVGPSDATLETISCVAS